MENVSEQWRPVNGYEGVYEVSSLGRVRTVARSYQDRRGRIYNKPQRILRCATSSQRYPMVDLYYKNKRCNKRVHRLVAAAFLGEAEEGHVVNHKNGDRFDNRVENLEYVTQGENVKHAWDNGLRKAS